MAVMRMDLFITADSEQVMLFRYYVINCGRGKIIGSTPSNLE